MSLTRTVPASVPSLFHSSRPLIAVVGREEQRAAHRRQVAGDEPNGPVPGLMSLTRTVPAAVPSLFHSSRPVDAVVGREEQRPAHGRQVVGVGAGR